MNATAEGKSLHEAGSKLMAVKGAKLNVNNNDIDLGSPDAAAKLKAQIGAAKSMGVVKVDGQVYTSNTTDPAKQEQFKKVINTLTDVSENGGDFNTKLVLANGGVDMNKPMPQPKPAKEPEKVK